MLGTENRHPARNPIEQSQVGAPDDSVASRSGGRIQLSQLWRRKGTLVLSTLAGLALAGAALKVFEPVYQVTARVWVERRTLPTEQTTPGDLPKDFVPTQAEIMRSALIVNQALAKLPPKDPTIPPELVTQSVIERFTVDPLIGTQILSVRFRDRSKERAVSTVESILEQYRAYVQNAEQESHHEALELLTETQRELQSEWETLQTRLQSLETEIAASSAAKDRAKVRQAWLADLGQSVTAATTRRMELEQQLASFFTPERVAAMNALMAQQRRDGGVQLVAWHGGEAGSRDLVGTTVTVQEIEESIGAVARMASQQGLGVDDPTPLRAAIQQAKSKEIALSQKLGPKHPELRAVRQELADLEHQLLAMVAAAPNTLQQHLSALQQQETEITHMYQRELQSAQKEFDQGKATDELLVEQQIVQDEMQRVSLQRNENLAAIQEWERVDHAVGAGKLGIVIRVLEQPVAIAAGLRASLPLVLGIGGLLGMVAGMVVISQQRVR
jgi:uncharacterized protein involved in exopolysaccharide biosynthesis